MSESPIYTFKSGHRVREVSAQDAGEFLEGLRRKTGKLLTEDIVRAAKAKSSPIHNAFQWDDRKAAHEYRKDQARHLVNCIQVKRVDVADPEPAFVNVKRADEQYYQSTRVAAANPDEWEIVHKSVLRQLASVSETLDRLNQVALKVNHKKRANVIKAKSAVDKAQDILSV